MYMMKVGIRQLLTIFFEIYSLHALDFKFVSKLGVIHSLHGLLFAGRALLRSGE